MEDGVYGDHKMRGIKNISGEKLNSEKIGLITIYIPTYKNEHLIIECVKSCIKQTYKNIQIIVVDNGYRELGEILKEKLSQLKDNRIEYIPNSSNIGSQGSFNEILQYARKSNRFMVIPADQMLVESCVQTMADAAQDKPSANIVYPRTIVRDIRVTALSSVISGEETPAEWHHKETGLVPSNLLIEKYFDYTNLNSEWNHFSYLGALIDGALIRSIGRSRFPLWDHGFEEMVCLDILSFTQDVMIINEPLLIQYTNNERLGTAKRVGLNYTRYEPLFVEYKYLENYEALLVRKGIKLSKLYISLIIKTVYSIIIYPGYTFLMVTKLVPFCIKLIIIMPTEVIIEVYKSILKIKNKKKV